MNTYYSGFLNGYLKGGEGQTWIFSLCNFTGSHEPLSHGGNIANEAEKAHGSLRSIYACARVLYMAAPFPTNPHQFLASADSGQKSGMSTAGHQKVLFRNWLELKEGVLGVK